MKHLSMEKCRDLLKSYDAEIENIKRNLEAVLYLRDLVAADFAQYFDENLEDSLNFKSQENG